jgi:phosphatidylserine/phosphatidylglycerophosphate/cardiolipin synthase-like enzyme
MTSQKTLFKNVTEAYTNLLAELDTAQSDISMMYYAFENDTRSSLHQTTEIFPRQPTTQKALSYACNLAAPWL